MADTTTPADKAVVAAVPPLDIGPVLPEWPETAGSRQIQWLQALHNQGLPLGEIPTTFRLHHLTTDDGINKWHHHKCLMLQNNKPSSPPQPTDITELNPHTACSRCAARHIPGSRDGQLTLDTYKLCGRLQQNLEVAHRFWQTEQHTSWRNLGNAADLIRSAHHRQHTNSWPDNSAVLEVINTIINRSAATARQLADQWKATHPERLDDLLLLNATPPPQPQGQPHTEQLTKDFLLGVWRTWKHFAPLVGRAGASQERRHHLHNGRSIYGTDLVDVPYDTHDIRQLQPEMKRWEALPHPTPNGRTRLVAATTYTSRHNTIPEHLALLQLLYPHATSNTDNLCHVTLLQLPDRYAAALLDGTAAFPGCDAVLTADPCAEQAHTPNNPEPASRTLLQLTANLTADHLLQQQQHNDSQHTTADMLQQAATESLTAAQAALTTANSGSPEVCSTLHT